MPKSEGLRKLLLKKIHDLTWEGHPRIKRTLTLMNAEYYLPLMKQDVEFHVKTCVVYQLDKTEKRKATGLLQPLAILEGPWESLSMDFIIGFLKVDGFTSIIVIMDRFLKNATFVPTPKECTTKVVAKLFMKNVLKLWGIQCDIVSDRDTWFTRRFWQALFAQLGTKLKFSMVNHLQTDGQIECVDAILEEYLRYFVLANQKN